MTKPAPQIGDRITFRAATRWSDKRATRLVNGFYLGQPTVRYGGSPNFIVKHDEIEAVEPAPSKPDVQIPAILTEQGIAALCRLASA